MGVVENVKPARERILDAAAAVMHDQGLANATTKAIAARAGYSEAMLYKHFVDKQELFLLVLKERMPSLRPRLAAAGTGQLAANLQGVVAQLMDYFADLFPMSVSIFSAPDLLAQHREGVARHGGIGPTAPIRLLAGYLDEERVAGRIRHDADTNAAASLLVGMAFHQGFLAAFEGKSTVVGAENLAASAVAIVLPGLL
ncbi:MAG TPA: TetR/AcrR family transcriptional regulator [Galbitalea sp.]|jgi:AcrR family transcriptional regulator|nr:TetR/AcrR family transcriptional regulator [Galbitalea sp.]